MKYTKSTDKRILVGMIVLSMIAVLLIIRAHYGMDVTDETLYLAMAKRFVEGDMIFKDEWNTCQLFGLLLAPFYKGYVWMHGNNEGILLFSREMFVAVTLVISCFAFRILYDYTKNLAESLIIAVCLLMYVRGNIITFSYYSVAQICFMLAIFLWIQGEKSRNIFYVFSGISYAISVVSMPYLAGIFLLILFCEIWCRLKKDERRYKIDNFIVGVIIAAGIFLVVYGKWIPWKHITEYLPYVFQDPAMEHEGILGEVMSVAKYFITVFLKYTWWLYLFTLLSCTFLKKRKKEVKIVLLLEFFLQAFYLRTYFEGGILIGIFLLAVQLSMLDSFAGRKEWINYFVIPGMIYALLWIIGSNVGERVMNMGFLIADIWAIDATWNSYTQEGNYIKITKRICVLWLLGILGVIRFLDVYRDGTISELATKVKTGAYQGIYTEENRVKAYENTVNLIREQTDSSDKLVVIGRNPWVYLETKARCVAYTAWNTQGEDVVAEVYYNFFPENLPDIIMTVDPEIQTYKNWRFSSHGSGMQTGETVYPEGVYKKIMQDGQWKEIYAGKSILYKKSE